MYAVAIGSPVTFIPQIIQLFASQDAGALSFSSWLFANLINILWLLYGAVHRELVVFISSAVWVGLNGAMLYGILLYS